MNKYIIVKPSRGANHPYSGPTCVEAGIKGGEYYSGLVKLCSKPKQLILVVKLKGKLVGFIVRKEGVFINKEPCYTFRNQVQLIHEDGLMHDLIIGIFKKWPQATIKRKG